MYNSNWLQNMSGKKSREDRVNDKRIEELSLSTAYFTGCGYTGNQIVDILNEMGFAKTELSVHIDKNNFREILKRAESNDIKVSGLHSICPKPENTPANRSLFSSFRISALDEEERKTAVKYIVDTCRRANEVGAKDVILHAGEVETSITYEKLANLYIRNKKEFQREKIKLIKEREARREKYIQNSMRSIEDIMNNIPSEVRISIETRSFHSEIPTVEEFDFLLNRGFSELGYWHDAGHASLQEKMGFVDSADVYIKEFGSRTRGIHIHDTCGTEDHLLPGYGNTDFSYLLPYLKKDSITNVLEINNRFEKEEVIKFAEEFEKIRRGD